MGAQRAAHSKFSEIGGFRAAGGGFQPYPVEVLGAGFTPRDFPLSVAFPLISIGNVPAHIRESAS